MRTHIRILAVLQIVYASIGILLGLGVLMIFGGVAAIVGINAAPEDSFRAVPILALIGTFAAGVLMVLSIPRLVAGIGLLRHRPWARILTIIVSIIGLFDVPVGLALGLYGLWVVLNREGAAVFNGPVLGDGPEVQRVHTPPA